MSKKHTQSPRSSDNAGNQSDNPQTGAEKKASRRKVLRNTLVGGAVISTGVAPEKWAKPVLDSVVLPAHASTTDDTSSEGPGNTTSAPTTPMPTTTRVYNANSTMRFNFSSWTDSVV